jgi:hypothetical protein
VRWLARRRDSGDRAVIAEAVSAPVITGDHSSIRIGGDHRFELHSLAPAVEVPDGAGPSAVLAAWYEVVPFTGRDSDRAELGVWLCSPSQVEARLVTAPGGQGKTRLALRLARDAQAARWDVLVARHVLDGGLIAATGASRPVRGRASGVLVVVDYADRWPLEDLLALFARPELRGDRVRVLLLGRSGQFWSTLAGTLNEVGITPSRLPLSDLASGGDERWRAFGAAKAAFARHFRVDDPAVSILPDLAGEGFALMLAVQMAALVTVLGPATACPPSNSRPCCATRLACRGI